MIQYRIQYGVQYRIQYGVQYRIQYGGQYRIQYIEFSMGFNKESGMEFGKGTPNHKAIIS